jgi:hypothetical protein
MYAQHFAKNLPDVIVGQFAERPQSLTRARTRFELFADTVSLVIGLRAENG